MLNDKIICFTRGKNTFGMRHIFQMIYYFFGSNFFYCRAVVWTDFIQFMLMLAAIIVIILLGTNNVGGFTNVWSAAERGGRLIMFK